MKKMRPIIKRVLTNLLLGFAFSWFVAWALAYIPHRVEPGRYSYSQHIAPVAGSDERISYYLHDSRWFGVWEEQFTTVQILRLNINFNTMKAPKQFWWAWEPFNRKTRATEQYISLKDRYQHLEPVPVVPDDRVFLDDGSVTHMDMEAYEPPPGWTPLVYSQIKYGWPALSHQADGAYDHDSLVGGSQGLTQVRGAISLPITSQTALAKYTIFPYRPIWSGLMVNTIFWAMIVASVRSIKRAYRHARRMRKGRCPMCSYELGFTFVDGCPECGWRKDPAGD